MLEQVFILFPVLLIGYTLYSAWLKKTPITMPMVFLAFGYGATHVLGVNQIGDRDILYYGAEAALALLLFADASMAKSRIVERSGPNLFRMLAFGLPMMIVLGAATAWAFLDGWPFWELFLIAAILAPTDAVLGQAVITNPSVTERDRTVVLVEGGFNDGLALPFLVLFGALAVGSTSPEATGTGFLIYLAAQLGIGALVGAVLGYGVGYALRYASNAGHMDQHYVGIATFAAVVLIFVLSQALGGNPFVAVFVAGFLFAEGAKERGQAAAHFAENDGHAFALLSFFFIGAVMVPEMIEHVTWAQFAMVLASLFVLRPLAIWISLIGTDIKPASRLLIGWFGPRGLATALFAIFVLNQFDGLQRYQEMISIAALAVVTSAVLHGVSAFFAPRPFYAPGR